MAILVKPRQIIIEKAFLEPRREAFLLPKPQVSYKTGLDTNPKNPISFSYADLVNGFGGKYGTQHFKPVNDDADIELKDFEIRSREDLENYKKQLDSILINSKLGFILSPRIEGKTLTIEINNTKSTSHLPELLRFLVEIKDKYEFGSVVGFSTKVSYGLEKNYTFYPMEEMEKAHSTFSTSQLNSHFAAFLDTHEVREFIRKG